MRLLAALPRSGLVQRHLTDDYFTPLWSHLFSLKLALPPAAVFIVTYALAFISGTPVSDVPKSALSYIRNTYFQSGSLMAHTCGLAILSLAAAHALVTLMAPPSYAHLVRLLLRGTSDSLQLVKEKLNLIRVVNADLAAQYGKVVEVFVEPACPLSSG